MKMRRSRLAAFFPLITLAAGFPELSASAQTPLGLSLQINSGATELTITGAAGATCQIQWTDNLSVTSHWSHLEHAVLSGQDYLLTDSTVPATSRYYRAVWTPNTNLVWIPPGVFTQGSPTNELHRSSIEGPQMTVTISRGFWMGKYEVTQGDYVAVMGTNPSYYNGDRSGPPDNDQDYGVDLSRPVEMVTWFDATNYCAKLTAQERAAGRIPTNSTYRLPTESEWEYACRAGTTTRFYYGDDLDYTNLFQYAWYYDTSDLQTHSVGQLLPNAWGLYDMAGNVWEWTTDWYQEHSQIPHSCCASFNPKGGDREQSYDPQFPAVRIPRKVIKGGSFLCSANYCRRYRPAARFPEPIDSSTSNIGFRCIVRP